MKETSKGREEEKSFFLWYGIGHNDQYNLAENGIGRFDSSIMRAEVIQRYKKYALLSPDFAVAMEAAVKSSVKDKERMFLVLCQVSPELFESANNDGIINPAPIIKYEGENKIVANFLSKEKSSGALQKSYIFTQTYGASKWRSVFMEASQAAGFNMQLTTPPQPKFEYIPPEKK